uniref:Aspartate racemase n=2 Tax=Anthurium amnicola TaxID=1678845 RepID=A0A1D1XPQ5_9ARAE
MLDGRMTVFSHTVSCPSQLVSGVGWSRSKARVRTWLSATPSARPSSVPLQTDGNDSVLGSKAADSGTSLMGSASSRPVLSQPNTVGVIGGVSAISTLTFLEKLVGWSSKDGEESLPFIVCSDPVLNRELSSKEKSSLSYLSSRSACFRVDRSLVVENLRRKRVFLERSGARCIVMPCNILHSWYREISDGCSVPFLHVGECVAKELKEANLRPVEAGSNVRIGVLSTDEILTAGFYQEKLQNLGFEVILPDKATMEHTVIPAVEAMNKNDMEGASTLIRIALQVLLVKAVSMIILASDDMRGLLPQDDPLLKKCFNPMDALARSTVEWAQSIEKTH